ncbi:MAG: sigma-54-dependent Fis family transcriptional regulator [Opitutales bacterium]|nr:sigma-54-dependent Fis family transcriptional regulator [Opitutales bacterium]
MTQSKILIIDDDAEIRYSLHRVLSSRGYPVSSAASGLEGIAIAEKEQPHVVFLDNRMEGMSGLETLQHLRTVSPRSMVILMTAFGTTQTAIEAMKFGAYDYIIKPFDIKKVLHLTQNAAKAYADIVASEGEYSPLLNSDEYKEGLVGMSDKMQEVFKVIGQVAASPVTVLITGESGTGKELVARGIHRHSHLSGTSFMAVNCAAIHENLIESELFGHEKGAFTGAAQQRIGVFEQCDGGTIFLDEIGDMALATQTKILRALQEGEIQRVGGTGTIKVSVRLIAATNKDLEKMVAEKTFREDLYYRLNVVRIRMPALRERPGDIPLLVDYMLQKMAKSRKIQLKQVSSGAMELLRSYRWPGNVRELENVIQRATVIAQGDTILANDLPQDVRMSVASAEPLTDTEEDLDDLAEELVYTPPAPSATPVESKPRTHADVLESFVPTPEPVAAYASAPATIGSGEISLGEAYDILYDRLRKEEDESILQSIERAMVERVLKETGGNQVKASSILGITRATLRKRIDQWSLRY